MKLSFPYGEEKIIFEIDERNVLDIIQPKKVLVGNEKEIIRHALENPVNSVTFKEFISDAKNILFIVNDGTRSTPTAKVINVIYDDIKEMNFQFIVAVGSHRKPTAEEFKRIFGKYHNIFRNNIIVHDAVNSEMINMGKTSLGTEVLINKLAVEADRIVVISSIEPHYFAGYTGGRKSFFPGIAGYRTIEQNHKLSLKPQAAILKLEGNPVHEDMMEAAGKVKTNTFAILLVTDNEHCISSASAGNIKDSFFASIPKADEMYISKVRGKADIVVAIIEKPFDDDLYQSHKGIENARSILKKNGILILVSKCKNGIGKNEFYDLLNFCNSPGEVFKKIEENYVLGYHKAAKLADFMQNHELWMVTDILEEKLKKIFIRTFDSLKKAIDNALELKGKNTKILFILDAAVTVPKM